MKMITIKLVSLCSSSMDINRVRAARDIRHLFVSIYRQLRTCKTWTPVGITNNMQADLRPDEPQTAYNFYRMREAGDRMVSLSKREAGDRMVSLSKREAYVLQWNTNAWK